MWTTGEDDSRRIIDDLVEGIRAVARRAKTEEDLRIGVEKLLEPALAGLGVDSAPEYERSYLRGRSDAVYGRVVIEYEPVGALERSGGVEHAAEQLHRYLRGEVEGESEEALRRVVGVGIDGKQIFFLRYRRSPAAPPELILSPNQQRLDLHFEDVDEEVLTPHVLGPYPVTRDSIENFLLYVRALRRRPLTPETLADEFGPDGFQARSFVGTLHEALKDSDHPKVDTFFAEWDRLFGIVYGEDIRKAEKDTSKLARAYDIKGKNKLKPLLFTVHTYYALLMKFLAAELASLQSGSLVSSPIAELPALGDKEVHKHLADLEDGGLFARLGIRNFLEGDFFSWYLSVWSRDLAVAVRQLARSLSEFEPATGSLEPEAVRDLLKKLYQYLVPRELRHDLGEYYTPDWIAELLLDEVEYDGDPERRVLDPACGSGTFLILAMRRVRDYAYEHLLDAREVVEHILSNVVGFDLNPLAVIAARTNYLLALGAVGRYPPNFEIPIYLSDSILTPTVHQGEQLSLLEEYQIPSTVGPFHIPRWVIEEGQLGTLTRIIEECVTHQYSPDEFTARAGRELSQSGDDQLTDLYTKILNLAAERRNGIWARIIKNAFAPVFAGTFDFVIGNPPWVNWESLSGEYRKATEKLWSSYGLVSGEGQLERMRGGKKDLAMLMLYASIDNYLKDGCRLAFVVPQTLFKTSGAGDGFRRFQVGKRVPMKVLRVNDMVDLQPFEGATNRTGTVVLERGVPTTYPVPYTIWSKTKRGRLKVDYTEEDVAERTERREVDAGPIHENEPTSPWITIPEPALSAIRPAIGESFYQAREGSNSGGLNGVYFVRILERRDDGNLVIENLPDAGKKDVPKHQAVIEPDLVYPLLRGRDIDMWVASYDAYYLLPQSREKEREGIPEEWMKVNLPMTYAYFKHFEDLVAARADRKYYPDGSPFYTMRNVADYTYAKYKVVWNEVGDRINAAVAGEVEDRFLGRRPIVPDHSAVLVPLDSEDEVRFVTAILNSAPARLVVSGYITGHPSPHVLDNVAVPQFDPKDTNHERLVELEARAEAAVASSDADELAAAEYEVDRTACMVWGITLDRLEAIREAAKEA